MIHLDRSKTKRPDFYYSKEWESFVQDTRAFYELPEKARSQSRHSFQNPNEIREIKEALIAEFYGKCAYTEAPLSYDDCVIIRHRPRMGAVGLESHSDRDHYWWLAYEWENLVPVLAECARAKGHYFPVDGARAEPELEFNRVREVEEPLFPDVSYEANRFKFEFDRDGFVQAKSSQDSMLIDLMGLNTDWVVKGRSDVIREVYETSIPLNSDEIAEFSVRFFDLSEAFLECKFQHFQKRLVGDLERESLGEWFKFFEAIPDLFGQSNLAANIPIGRLVSMFTALKDELLELRKFQTEGKMKVQGEVDAELADSSVVASQTLIQKIAIERIEIKNFRGIDAMTIAMPQETAEVPSGLMILGENGSGKSSILQAIALALEVPENLAEHPFLTINKVLRRGEESGYVRLFLLDKEEPLEVRFSKDHEHFEFDGPRGNLSFYLRAYGAHRLLPPPEEKQDFIKRRVPIANKNLWDAYESLVDAEGWVMQLDEGAFNAFALALKDLLNLKDGGFVSRDIKKEKLYFDIGEKELALEDLSAGYQSIITTAADIIAGYPITATDMTTAPGIVMIDEIGAHLHPSWRMRIVNAYRKTFSSIQFIATTHEPLCLRGVRQEEVIVMQREGRRVKKVANLPNIEQLRIDQILTSPIFGMNTTVDPRVEEQFIDYYRLLALEKPTAEEKSEAKRLKHILYRYGVLGSDRRSRAIYDIIDKELATQETAQAGKRLSANTRRKVKELWADSALEFDR